MRARHGGLSGRATGRRRRARAGARGALCARPAIGQIARVHPDLLIAAPGAGTDAPIRRFHTRMRVRADVGGGAAAVLERALAPGCIAMPAHRRVAVTEALHVLAGTLVLRLEGVGRRRSEGATAVVPPGARHPVRVEVDAPAPARVLAVVSPGGMERHDEGVAASVPDPSTARGPDMAGVGAAGVRHGIGTDMMSLYDLIARHGLALA